MFLKAIELDWTQNKDYTHSAIPSEPEYFVLLTEYELLYYDSQCVTGRILEKLDPWNNITKNTLDM